MRELRDAYWRCRAAQPLSKNKRKEGNGTPLFESPGDIDFDGGWRESITTN